jgi:type IV pilus assembly protein PilB
MLEQLNQVYLSMSVTEPSTLDASSNSSLSPVARVLVQQGKIAEAKAVEIMQQTLQKKSNFIAEVIAAGLIDSAEIAYTLAQTFAMPLLDISAIDKTKFNKNLIDFKLAAECKLLPLSRKNGRLIVATADPGDQIAAKKMKFAIQLPIDWVVVEYPKLIAALTELGASANESLEKLTAGGDFNFDDITSVDDEAAKNDEDGGKIDSDDAPVVRFFHKMLVDAINMRASDLHFEPYEFSYRVRFRIDGELREIASAPPAIKDRLASRIKVLSKLDISEKRVPQDGRMKLRLSPEKTIDFRVSTLPTLFGEKVVIRILDPSSARMGIDALGYDAIEKERLIKAIYRPYGMILVTGPTGSGKTVSLYSCLNLLNAPGVNIATAEDPAEINMPGINQVNVNDKAGLTFAAALKSFLRQDPDIIMVGEIRDLETADIAIKAAQTGHMVLSTLHTNDAPTTLTRLRNMGVAPFNIASSVILITAQRLARRLCTKCKAPTEVPRNALLDAGFTESQLDGSWQPYKAVGCEACNNGYKGRVGIYQVMPITEEIQKIILADGSALDIAMQSEREGVRNLRQSGLQKVIQGLTSLEEVLAVTNE